MAPLALLVRQYVSRCRCVLQSALAICSIFTPAACLSLTHTVSGVVSLCGVGFSILRQAMVTSRGTRRSARTRPARPPPTYSPPQPPPRICGRRGWSSRGSYARLTMRRRWRQSRRCSRAAGGGLSLTWPAGRDLGRQFSLATGGGI